MIRKFLPLAFFCLTALAVFGQSESKARATALQFLRENPAKFGLNATDVADVRVTDEYVSKNNGVTHVWVQQQHLGIPLFNGLFGLHVKPDGKVVHLNHRFVPDLQQRVNTTLPSLGASRAVEMAMNHLGFAGFSVPSLKQKINDRNWVFEGGAISREDIPVSSCFTLLKDGSVHLAWTMVIYQANTSDVWNLQVDAQTGEILAKLNYTVYCKAGDHATGRHDDNCAENTVDLPATPALNSADETYRVFALPVESPAHGPRQLLVNPADPIASPYGWLDLNGAPGAENTYTNGNNVWAYDDLANDNTGSIAESVDGTANLLFDFPFDPDAEPAANRKAAITNLFYVNNMMHDITYRYGFDEPAGNFQENNYSHGGASGDQVNAEALDGGGTDNANFSTPPDGSSGRMQMYVWNRQGGKIVTANAPGAVLGAYLGQAADTWGAPITTTPVTGDVVVVNDGSAEATLGCNPPVNNVNGKIAMVDRGSCQFGTKALNVEQAGAIACIICNFEDATQGMAAGNDGGSVTIPVVMMKKSDCDLLRQYAGNGLNLSIGLPTIAGPNQLDGDFDNGIISHEYGHGISNRLTGGPSNTGCLGNAEQMGEGWSDWFSLITTVKPGDIPTQKRGVGTYVFRQDNDGQGIRRYPYSTDMNINPITFSTVAQNTEVHALGEIWTQMLWDLYWAMVEKYGYDPDINNPNSGNARAIQLVMDGMKLQPCSPGFQDGRDAIRLADELNYNGADTCLISTVFARRGLGYYASQNDSNNAGDGIENFDPIPTCIKELKITKTTSTPLIDPGAEAVYEIKITNHKDETATGVVVTDELPAGLSFVSASNGGTFDSGLVTWNLGDMPTGAVITLTYRAKAAAGVESLCYYRNPMDELGDWFSVSLEATTATSTEEYFTLQSSVKKVGTAAWYAPENSTLITDFTLEQSESINVYGTKPVLRFWHQFNTEAGADAGFVEVQVDGETQWRRFAADKVFRNPYSGKVQYGTFAIPFLDGFSGNSNGWIQSFIDVSDYIGKKVKVRFRFGNDDNTAPANGGWFVDEVQLIDMVNFEGSACVHSAQGDLVCAGLPQGGVIVNTSCTTIGTDEPEAQQIALTVQPNPAHDVFTVTLHQALEGAVKVSLIGSDGRLAMQQIMDNGYDGQVITFDVQNLPAGVYLVRLESNQGNQTEKVMVR